jgi:hypothetical protein
VRSHPTAGQATLEYIAAVALMAALLLVAAPAVGAPTLGRSVAEAIRHGICIVGGDICSRGDARRAGLAPCPLETDLTGAEGSVTAFSVELGGKWLLTVTPNSDGTVTIVRTAGGTAGVAGGSPRLATSIGPVKFDVGAEGAVRARILPGRGWVLPDREAAGRFLEHAAVNSFKGWPPTWRSLESGVETAGEAGVSSGSEDHADGRLVGVTAGGAYSLGYRTYADGAITTYSRWSMEGPEVNIPFTPSPVGLGKADWVAEYTRGPHGEPREFVLRTATVGVDNKLTEIVAHLDLTDPANAAVVEPALGPLSVPQAGPAGSIRQFILNRVASHGVVERLVSDVDDTSRGASLGVAAGLKFALAGKRVSVHRTLVAASVERRGLVGQRLDCVGSTA